MKTAVLSCIAVLLLASSCRKAIEIIIDQGTDTPSNKEFVKYTIRAGEHYSDNNPYKAIELSELNFVVRFDSSAIYTTQLPENQLDINKLYGFSDNNSDHHQYSARFGWQWSSNALRLFGYVYNSGKVISKELTTVEIGSETNCRIEVADSTYNFTVKGVTHKLLRKSTTAKASGYRLYPYFGGDEPAPHEVRIWIKNL